MEFIDAFLMATAWAYFGCVILTILGKPPMANIRKELQGIFYFFACLIFQAASVDIFPQYIYSILGIVYSIASLGSFIGYPQVWAAYWKENPEQGSDAAQIGMATWDLAIGVFCFMKLVQ